MESRPMNYAASYIIGNFVLWYVLLCGRAVRAYYRIDNNISPRYDMDKYGPQAVKSGKISQSVLDTMKRAEAAHLNAIEHFPLFIGTMVFAVQANLPAETVNTFGAAYTVARIAFWLSYVVIDSFALSYVRSAVWWASNLACFATLYQCGQVVNS